jgi:hypothetical protein
MYQMVVSAISLKTGAKRIKEATPDKEPEPDEVGTVTDAVIQRRLAKIDGLRAHLRRSVSSCFGLMPTVLASRAVAVVSSEDGELSQFVRSPVTKLKAPQRLLMGESCGHAVVSEEYWDMYRYDRHWLGFERYGRWHARTQPNLCASKSFCS